MAAEKKKGLGCCGVLVFGALGLIVLAIMFRPEGGQAPPPKAGPRVGDVATLELPGANGVWVATTRDDVNPMLDAQNARDMAAIHRLAEAGRVRLYPNGTRVRLIGSGFALRQVEILASEFPEDVGRTGWVQAELVQ